MYIGIGCKNIKKGHHLRHSGKIFITASHFLFSFTGKARGVKRDNVFYHILQVILLYYLFFEFLDCFTLGGYISN